MQLTSNQCFDQFFFFNELYIIHYNIIIHEMSQHSEAIYWPIVISTLLVVLLKHGVHCFKKISSKNGSFQVHPSEVPVCLNSHPMYC